MKSQTFTLLAMGFLLLWHSPSIAQFSSDAAVTPAGQGLEVSGFQSVAKSSATAEAPGLMVSPGLTLAVFKVPNGYKLGLIPLSIFVDKGITDYLTIGGYLGYTSFKYENNTNKKYNRTALGARACLHAFPLINRISESNVAVAGLEPYLVIGLGADINSNQVTDTNSTDFRFSIAAGSRYYFSDLIAVFAELGYGAFGVFTVGATFKFGGPTP